MDRSEGHRRRASSVPTEVRQTGQRPPRPLRAVRADRRQGRGRSSNSPRCVPASRCTPSPRGRWNCSSCRAPRRLQRRGGRRHRPLRAVRQARQYLCLAEGGRPYTIDLARAVFLIEEKEEIARNRVIRNGRRATSRCSTAASVRTSATASSTARSPGPRAGVADPGRSPATAAGDRQAGCAAASAPRRRRPRPWRRRPPRRHQQDRRRRSRKRSEGESRDEGREESAAAEAVQVDFRASEPAQPVLTAKPVVAGGKRVVIKPAREDAPF